MADAGRRMKTTVWRGCRVTLLAEIRDERSTIIGLQIDTPGDVEITSELLRHLPIARLVRELDGELGWGDKRMRARVKRKAARLRAAGPTAETLAEVAALYVDALRRRVPPTQAVEEVLGIPRSTAGRWVARARAAGYLASSRGVGRCG